MEIGSPEWKQVIVDGARRFDLEVTDSAVNLFAAHALELLKWNRKINLTAISDPLEVAVKHYLDSIAPIRLFARPASLLDIGSGGGFPGIPLKIMMPDLPATLIDASRKKVAFLRHAARLLGLDRFQAIHTRVEDLAHRSTRPQARQRAVVGAPGDCLPESFGLIVIRALSPLHEFLARGMPILSEGGLVAAFKGRVGKQEIDRGRLADAGWSVAVHRYELPYLHLKRSVVLCRRRSTHPDRVRG